MSLKQLAGALIGGSLVYVALAARVGPVGVSWLTEMLKHPVPEALADISGTRLKTKYILGADGSRLDIPDVMRDSQLGVDCSFRAAADGLVRCLPLPPDPAGQSFGYGDVVYTDNACTNGFVWVAPPPSGCSATVPVYAMSYTDAPYCSGQDPRAHIFPVGSLLPPQSGPFYYINGSGACVSGGITASNGIPYSIGTELVATTFAPGTAGIDP